MSARRILNVGQCGMDHGTISRFLKQKYGAEVTGSDTAGQALATLRLGGFDLVLVNRVLDADGSSGVELIRAIKSDPDLAPVPVMLVSNFEKAQADAQQVGALAGFGKDDIRSGRPIPALESVIIKGD